jgi:hypothetical protein
MNKPEVLQYLHQEDDKIIIWENTGNVKTFSDLIISNCRLVAIGGFIVVMVWNHAN